MKYNKWEMTREKENCCFYEDGDCIHPAITDIKCRGVDCGFYYGKDELIYDNR